MDLIHDGQLIELLNRKESIDIEKAHSGARLT